MNLDVHSLIGDSAGEETNVRQGQVGVWPPSQVAKNKGESPGCRFHWALVSFSNVKSMAGAVCREVRWVCSKEAAWARGRG